MSITWQPMRRSAVPTAATTCGENGRSSWASTTLGPGRAKPAPDIIEAALARADLVPGLAVVVGDAVWDGQSADRAGTGFVGVESGGVSADELTRAGASMVAADTLELLVRYDETPLARLGAARAGARS